jgi:hypothetical protein
VFIKPLCEKFLELGRWLVDMEKLPSINRTSSIACWMLLTLLADVGSPASPSEAHG